VDILIPHLECQLKLSSQPSQPCLQDFAQVKYLMYDGVVMMHKYEMSLYLQVMLL